MLDGDIFYLLVWGHSGYSNAKLTIGGIFCGQLFGLEDSWASNKDMTFHPRKSLDTLFRNFRIHHLHEENSVSKTSSGEEKNWHIFDLVAVKLK